MPRLLALEWDGAEARVAVGTPRGKALVVEQAFAVPLPKRASAAGLEQAIGSEIAAALAQRGLAKLDALVAVGRANIELRFMTIPLAPPEELPDMVRFQAMRQFTTLGEDWPLDFVPLGAPTDAGMNVLAAAISPELLQQTLAICEAAGVTAKRLVLRPFAAAALLKKEAADGRCRMLVDLLGADADLTVMVADQVVFPRTVRLPEAEGETVSRALVGEVRRTMMAAQNQLGGRRVEQLVIFGDGAHQSSLSAQLQQELSLPCELLDPLAAVETTDRAARERPEMASAFAPLVGLLTDEAAEQPPAIDFLHPRQRPVPPDRTRLYTLAGSAAAVVALAFFGLIWLQLHQLDRRIYQLNSELTEQADLAKKGKTVRDDVARIDQFEQSDVLWLDELRHLSRKFPPAEHARVDELFATSKGTDEQALVSLQGMASDASTISQIEQALTDDRHVVTGAGSGEDPKATGLRWRFKEDIRIAPEEEPSVNSAAPASGATTKDGKKAGAPSKSVHGKEKP